MFLHSQIIERPDGATSRTLEINLVQPSLLRYGEMELQRQNVTPPDHTAALCRAKNRANPKGNLGLSGEQTASGDSGICWFSGSTQRQRAGRKVLPRNQCLLIFQWQYTGGSDHNVKRPWLENTVFFFIHASCNTMDTDVVWLQPTLSLFPPPPGSSHPLQHL